MSKRRRDDDEESNEHNEVTEIADGSDNEPEEVAVAEKDVDTIHDGDDDRKALTARRHDHRLPQVDEEYGQRPMFDAARLKTYDSDQEVEDTDSVAAYLAQVNVERRALPQLVNSTDREAQLNEERAQGEDHRGRFVDGYYAVEPTSGPRRAHDADQEYFNSIIAGYQTVRDVVTQPWHMEELAELSRYGYLSLRFEEACAEHRVNLATVILPLHTPQQIEIKYMEAQTAWYILTNVLKLLFALEKGKPLNNNVGTWIYFLLARIEPMQAQTADTISDLRGLAQLLVEARDSIRARGSSEGLVAADGPSSMTPTNQPATSLANDRAMKQGYFETCQIVDTLLIIIGVYFRQRDLLELRRPLPEPELAGHDVLHDSLIAVEDLDQGEEESPAKDQVMLGPPKDIQQCGTGTDLVLPDSVSTAQELESNTSTLLQNGTHDRHEQAHTDPSNPTEEPHTPGTAL